MNESFNARRGREKDVWNLLDYTRLCMGNHPTTRCSFHYTPPFSMEDWDQSSPTIFLTPSEPEVSSYSQGCGALFHYTGKHPA